MNYNGSISQKSRVKDSKYIFKEIKLYYLGWPIWGYPCELWKTKITRAAHVYKHTHTQSHTHTRKHTKTMHACKDTHTHTKCSFVIGGPSLWNHLPHTVKEAGSNSLSRYLKRSYLVNLSKYRLVSEFVTVTLTLFDLFVVKYGAKCPTYRTKLPFLHELCMERSKK